MPECYKPLYKRACVGYVMKACARRADRIISVSGNNKEMIIRYLKAPEDKISVIYHGVEDDYRKGANPESIEACKKDLGISGRYLFSVANNYHHKNLEGLFKAFVYLKDRYDIPHKLVIAGNSGFSKERRAWLEKMKKIVPDFVHLGYIGHELLPYLHNGADAMIFSSQCESFGMPLVEAMACGVPIVASRIFAIPEVVKDAAILVNPYDYIEMGDAIYKVLTDNGVKSALVDRALARARDFSWEETARQTLDIYGQVFKKARAA